MIDELDKQRLIASGHSVAELFCKYDEYSNMLKHIEKNNIIPIYTYVELWCAMDLIKNRELTKTERSIKDKCHKVMFDREVIV